MDFFEVDHNIDNYEEQININEVCFVRCSYRPLQSSDGWSSEASIMFRNGRTEKVSFTVQGYKDFIDVLRGD